jgi:hypothetical protein
MAYPYEDRSDDPGWGGARMALSMILPFVAIGHPSHRASADGLMIMRLLFVYFIQMLVIMGVVVIGLDFADTIEGGDLDSQLVGAMVLAVSVVSLVASRLLPLRLDCSSDEALLHSYRTRFIVRLALSEAGAMAGFVGFVVTAEPLLYGLGVAFTALGFSLGGSDRPAVGARSGTAQLVGLRTGPHPGVARRRICTATMKTAARTTRNPRAKPHGNPAGSASPPAVAST